MRKNLLAISLLTMGCLYGILAIVIILLFFLLDLPISYGILLSLVIVIIQFLIAPNVNDFVFKHFYKVDFNYDIPDYLKQFINEICTKYNMNYPKIGFINDGSPNAFTYGRTKNDARVVFTKGIFDLLTEEEVKTVAAHEIGHAKHYDMLFMTVAQIVPLVLYYIYEILLGNNTRRSSRSNDNDSADYSAIVGLIAYVLYIISQYIILWLSRTREYYADRFAIEETKDPTALSTALIKIGFGLAVGNKEEKSKTGTGNALGISNAKFSKGMAIASYNNGGVTKQNVVNAMKWEQWNVWAKWNELNSTHPLISNRLLTISEQCEEFGQAPYIVFDEQKPESYVDDFIKEILISIIPFIILMATPIVAAIYSEIAGLVIGIGGIIFTISLFKQLDYTHRNSGYIETNVSELMSEVKVSHITSIPCILEGEIIGRGNPGCIFNEDFVIKDETGIMFLDYNQPLHIIEKIFAIFKSQEYFNKKVKVQGWFRRGVVPYIEVRSIEIDGVVKKCHTYTTTKVVYGILMAIFIGLLFMSVL
ncbi:MAG: hypothetical protein E7311_02750 [Clostridiales bacterium]|nr:hypothetical protein [Clostridiales bacterium]